MAADSLFGKAIFGALKFFPPSSDPIKSKRHGEVFVDPRIQPEQIGCSPEPGKSEDGVNYLLRLKRGLAKDAPVEAKPDLAAVSPPGAGLRERRRSPRLRCSGSVEFRVQDSDVRMWGTLTDISLHGCYVEMSATFPLNAKVSLVLSSCGIRVQAPGTVRASYPALGMGICFGEIETAELTNLKRLLGILAGHPASSPVVPVADNGLDAGMMDAIASADPAAFLAEITACFQKKSSLSREDFCQIAKRVRRS